ncbi:MAG: XRE family transcriptional regulator [Deltaproteobacteria bacterium]|nr:XRE family transcriptional regulator [Deltaproteobacteria bacterium]
MNIENVKRKSLELGLSQVKLAKELNVSREAVSQWFKGEKFPRPGKLLKLAQLLKLAFTEIVTGIPSPDDPVVAFRKKGGHKITDDYIDRAKDMGRMLANLVPYLPFDELTALPTLRAPMMEYSYVQRAAKRIRDRITGRKGETITFQNLINFFGELKAVLIPVLWGSKDAHENALHIYLPDSMTSWIYLNLDCRQHDFKFWMAHELGHVYSPDLTGKEEGEDFADAFAGALLFPEELAIHEYTQLRRARNMGKVINQIKNVAVDLVVSPYTVYREINKYAENYDKPTFDLESEREIYKANTNFHKAFKTISESLFKDEVPSPSQYVSISKLFDTPFFDVLRKYLIQEKKSPTFLQSILSIPFLDAQGLYEELC